MEPQNAEGAIWLSSGVNKTKQSGKERRWASLIFEKHRTDDTLF